MSFISELDGCTDSDDNMAEWISCVLCCLSEAGFIEVVCKNHLVLFMVYFIQFDSLMPRSRRSSL